jgi:hypothetical protein
MPTGLLPAVVGARLVHAGRAVSISAWTVGDETVVQRGVLQRNAVTHEDQSIVAAFDVESEKGLSARDRAPAVPMDCFGMWMLMLMEVHAQRCCCVQWFGVRRDVCGVAHRFVE